MIKFRTTETKPLPADDLDTGTVNASYDPYYWFFYLLSYISSYINSLMEYIFLHPEKQQENQFLMDDWYYVLNKTEEFLIEQSLNDSIKIQNELTRIKQKGQFIGTKLKFIQLSKEKFASLKIEDQKILEYSFLASDKKNSIISRLVKNYQTDWLTFIETNFLLENQKSLYNPLYWEKGYQKNIVGGIKDSMFLASHGIKTKGFTALLLADILWSIWNTLYFSLKNEFSIIFLADQADLFISKIFECSDMLITLWLKTISNSQFGSKHEGLIVAQWKEKEKEMERKKLEKISQFGIDASFLLKDNRLIPSGDSIKRDNHQIKSLLEKKLIFRQNHAY
jgi:hypothetical protein